LDEPDKIGEIGHFFVVSVNIKEKRFELLDSLGGKRYEKFFFKLVEVLKEIWKVAFRKSNNELSPPTIDHFEYCKISVPQQGQT